MCKFVHHVVQLSIFISFALLIQEYMDVYLLGLLIFKLIFPWAKKTIFRVFFAGKVRT